MTGLSDTILAEIDATGPITFARYMELALYHPDDGYYASGSVRTGRAGHFLTSPEIDPAYGALWARGFESIWESCERPAEFEIAEIGPGEGAFADAVLGHTGDDFAGALTYRLIEPVRTLAERQRARLGRHSQLVWSQHLDEMPAADAGVVFANEVLDNQPVNLVERDGGELWELRVDRAEDGLSFTRVAAGQDAEDFFTRAGVVLPESHRAEIPLAAAEMARLAASKVLAGAVIVVDYGDTAAGLVARPAGSVVCYSRTGADDSPLIEPGAKDITAHVNWTVTAAAMRDAEADTTTPLSQRTVLKRLGLADIDARLRGAVDSDNGRAVVRAISRRGALAALVDPGGLGRLQVLAGLRGIDPPKFLMPE